MSYLERMNLRMSFSQRAKTITKSIALTMLAILFLCAAPVKAQQAVALLPPSHQQFFTSSGQPNAGGCLFFYNSGTSTPAPTYTDVSGTILNTNPVILDSTGSATIYLANQSYTVTAWTQGGVNCASGTELWSQSGVNAYQITSSAQNITFAGVTSYPAGVPGEVVYRTDLGRLCFFYSVWDCLMGIQTADSPIAKTFNVQSNALVDNTNTIGTYLRNNGTQYLESTIQNQDLQGLSPVFNCVTFTVGPSASVCGWSGTGNLGLTTAPGLISATPAGLPACFNAGGEITTSGCTSNSGNVLTGRNITASVPVTTLCAAATCAAGQYTISLDFIEQGAICSSIGSGGVSAGISWTDANGYTRTAAIIPISTDSSNTFSATFTAQPGFPTAYASGSMTINTNGSAIQFLTGYVACTTGTFTYGYDVAAIRLQ
jgi:hypothetical protein